MPLLFVLRVDRRVTVFFVVVGRRIDEYNAHTEPPTRLGHEEVCPALTKAYSTRELALSNVLLHPIPIRLLTLRTVDPIQNCV